MKEYLQQGVEIWDNYKLRHEKFFNDINDQNLELDFKLALSQWIDFVAGYKRLKSGF